MYPNDPYQQPQQQPVQPQYAQPQPQGYPSGPVPVPGMQPGLSPSNFIVPPRKPSKIWLILSIVFIVLFLGAAGFGVWAFMGYVDNRDNVDSKVSSAVATAVKEQADKDAADFLEKEKQPNRQFVGPDDYGRVSFDYPKTWSVYVDEDAVEGGTYQAYFNPATVPPVSNEQQYALRLTIQDRDYDQVLTTYNGLISRGDLSSNPITTDGQSGTRLEGAFTKDIRGYAVVFKIRDKTVTIRTDAEPFKGDFDALVQTITFNK